MTMPGNFSQSLRRTGLAVGALLLLTAGFGGLPVTQAIPQQDAAPSGNPEGGIPVDHEATVLSCVRCHAMDDEGRMSRISYERKTPEGWQTTIRRMVGLNGAELDPETARDILRYLSDNHGLAPEEARPGFFEAERRVIVHDYEDDDTEVVCVQCHSMGRVITQRRTAEEWGLLVAMHRGYYPFVDFQGTPAWRRRGRPDPEAADSRHPVDKALAHLVATYPFETDEWTAWSTNRRDPRLAGRWAVEGRSVGGGPLYGTVEVAAVDGAAGEFTTEITLINARSGAVSRRSGVANVYTGFQWRGRSTGQGAADDTLREVMFVERDWRQMSGRWFTGAYDEIGIDVTLHRGDVPVISGVYPVALRNGTEMQELTIYGANLPTGVAPADIDFGPRVMVTEIIDAADEAIRVLVSVATDAVVGRRDLFVGSLARAEALAVYDSVDAVRVTPEHGMARIGGVVVPKQFAQFEAIGVSNGADGEAGTEDDFDLGVVDVTWGLEEYSATFDDDDIEFIGSLDANGMFTPAIDGPNPERSGNRNNIGDVWVVATYEEEGREKPLRGRALLLVTVPLYMNFQALDVGR